MDSIAKEGRETSPWSYHSLVHAAVPGENYQRRRRAGFTRITIRTGQRECPRSLTRPPILPIPQTMKGEEIQHGAAESRATRQGTATLQAIRRARLLRMVNTQPGQVRT